MVEICRNGDALQTNQSRTQHLRSCRYHITARQSILVQVHVHGGDVGKRGGLSTNIRTMDGVATGRASVEYVH